MTKTISILGCGWLGKPLAFKLSASYSVKASNRSIENAVEFEKNNIKHYAINLEDKTIATSNFLKANVLILPIAYKNIANFERLVNEIEKSSIQHVIFISSTSVYDNTNGTVTENAPTNNSALSQIEKLFLNASNFDTTIIRFSGLFGYNRNPANFISASKKMPNPEGYVNLIHRDDCIAIIEEIIKKDCWNTIFNACCSSHPKRNSFYIALAKSYNKPSPDFESGSSSYKLVSNAKLVNTLNYEFIYNDLTKI
ncbi:NAD(P)H-binding protein [Bizionia gelidisalsuginis]|uniref:NAD(P)H-binding protein n=1 Tax=Bizionia gelidisalsuginis TaxID=291188 RepID=A0ABY3MCZ4_9FLAO|nr:NAD(P)H-binding protein [Bizionia gelidisalsuginis]TYC16232.1 NAD(P)H-binding protein [Bizionia gelidisalsuginis]